MKLIAITQRSYTDTKTRELRDCLDRRWPEFLNSCGYVALPIPNHPEQAAKLLEALPIGGVLLTGGGSIKELGGSDSPRDEVETFLLNYAIKKNVPFIGVCRGMQRLQASMGVTPVATPGHVAEKQTIEINGKREEVNSYHDYGTKQSIPELTVWASADDGVVKALSHTQLPLHGIMWHPERISPFREEDIRFFQRVFQ